MWQICHKKFLLFLFQYVIFCFPLPKRFLSLRDTERVRAWPTLCFVDCEKNISEESCAYPSLKGGSTKRVFTGSAVVSMALYS